MRNWLIFILFILISLQRTNAQQPAYFMFGQDQFEGVSIYNIIQDFNQNYYFATNQGLYVHDGYNFKKIECESMKASSVFNFVIDSKGVIYCSNLSQQIFKIENGICSLIFEIPDNGIHINLIVNKQDELYISTSEKLYVLNKKHELIHTPKIVKDIFLGPPFLLEDGKIVQHLSNKDQLLVYSNGNSQYEFITYPFSHKKGDNLLHFFHIGHTTYCINILNKKTYKINLVDYSTQQVNIKMADESAILRYYTIDNALWVCDQVSGVFLLNDQLQRTNQSAKIFDNYFISNIYQDHEGNILLATFNQGIIVIPNRFIHDILPTFSDYKITRIIKGAQNELLFGTSQGGILKYDGKLSILSTSSNKSIEHIFYWPKYQLVLEDTRGLSVHLPEKKMISLGHGALKDAIETKENELLLSLNTGLRNISFDPKTKTIQQGIDLITERTYSLAKEQNSNRIYVSTASGLRYNNGNSEYKLLTDKGEAIRVLYLRAYRDLVFATHAQNGILLLKNGKVLKKITPIYNETPLTIFKLIIEDELIYANTQLGFFILNMEGEIINTLNKSNGLITNKVIDFELFYNQLWVTHTKGIQYFDKDKINNKVPKPNIVLNEIFINDMKVEDINKLGEFNSDQRNLSFSFRTPTLRYRGQMRYHFKLEGYAEDWNIHNYENHKVEYNALAPGDYRFIVKAENNGVFSEPVYYSFRISAPFYQQWWFIILILLAITLLITTAYKYQLNIQKKKAKQINELNASRLTAIQSQMNPHFIFNALNSIQDLVLKGDIDNSYTFITKFSNLVRRTLNYSDKDFIDFEQEIKLIELYLSLEKLRFKEELDYTIHTNDIEDIKIPPMMIQPFIENALVHGLLHKAGKKQLTINFTLNEVLICEIIDNGIGREKALEIKKRQGDHHESFAVNAIKRRFQILTSRYGGQLGFSMEDIVAENEVVGTKVTLRIPVQLKY